MKRVRTCFMLVFVFLLMIGCTNQAIQDHTDEHSIPVMISLGAPTVTTKDFELYSQEIQNIYLKGSLVVSLYAKDRYPFFYVDEEGNLVGSDIDIANSIAASLGVKAEFDRSAQTFDEIVDNVASGKADLAISKLSQTLERGKKVIFTEPYLNLHQALLINRLELARIRTKLKDPLEIVKQSKESIGVIGGTSYVGFAEDMFRESSIVEYENQTELIDATVNGSVLASFYDGFEIKEYIRKNPGKSIEMQIIILDERVDPIAIAVAPYNQHLYAWLNIFLKTNKIQIEDLLEWHGII